MAHIITTLIIGLVAGLITFFFSGWAVKSKAYRASEESKFAKYIRESKESAFALVAGFSIWMPALYGVTSQPKHTAVISGGVVWCIIAVASGVYWYRKHPSVFTRSQ